MMYRTRKKNQTGKRAICALLSLMLLAGLMVYGLPGKALAAEGPTEDEVHNVIMGMKDEYPEGRHWTNDDFYAWKGGFFYGGYGCVAFAFILSDAAFGDLPCRVLYDITIKNVHVGDILRVNNDTHTVIVTEVHDTYVVLAEGNYDSSIHWGRTMSAAEVAGADYLITRYPTGTFTPYYTVEFDLNNGNGGMPPAYKDQGTAIMISLESPAMLGYELWGWAFRADASEPDFLPGDLYREDKNATLYAVWRPAHYTEIKNTFPAEYEAVFTGYDVLYEFTPAKTAEYTFESKADGLDPVITIFNTAWEKLYEADDIGYPEELDFSLTCELNAGEQYFICLGLWGYYYYGDSYTVSVSCNSPDSSGDVNHDGTVDLKDAALLFRWWNGQAADSALDLNNGDFDGNAEVDLRDAAAIFRK